MNDRNTQAAYLVPLSTQPQAKAVCCVRRHRWLAGGSQRQVDLSIFTPLLSPATSHTRQHCSVCFQVGRPSSLPLPPTWCSCILSHTSLKHHLLSHTLHRYPSPSDIPPRSLSLSHITQTSLFLTHQPDTNDPHTSRKRGSWDVGMLKAK